MAVGDPATMHVIVGLVVGLAFILLLAIIFGGGTTGSIHRNISIVTIPYNASLYEEGKASFEPKEIKVMLGVNNTIRWINRDSVPARISADNEADPNFYNATKDFVLILPNKNYEYTFTKVGQFGYHGAPWQRGTIIVVDAKGSLCAPSSLASINLMNDFKVRQPTSLPQGYVLGRVEADDGGRAGVALYYANHSLCPFQGTLTDQIQEGTLVITVMKADDIANGTDFQQRETAFYANDPDGTIAKVQALDIAGHKAIGWEPFTGKNVIRENGKVVQSTPMQLGGMVRFFDDSDKTIYTITAMQPLGEITKVAASIK